jgi:acyl-CoA thioester hydrolase
MKLYTCRLEVRGYELDSFGHVNHSVYLNYLEHGRWRMLNDEGITLDWIEREKLWPVIVGIEIRYLKPTFMGDVLEVRTQVVEHSRSRFTLEQTVYRDDIAVTTAKVQSVVINQEGRPVRIPEPYTRLWKEMS